MVFPEVVASSYLVKDYIAQKAEHGGMCTLFFLLTCLSISSFLALKLGLTTLVSPAPRHSDSI
jgi:hypothetical protein